MQRISIEDKRLGKTKSFEEVLAGQCFFLRRNQALLVKVSDAILEEFSTPLASRFNCIEFNSQERVIVNADEDVVIPDNVEILVDD